MRALWQYIKTNTSLGKMLEFLLRMFCQLFHSYYKGNKHFGCAHTTLFKVCLAKQLQPINHNNVKKHQLYSYMETDIAVILLTVSYGSWMLFHIALQHSFTPIVINVIIPNYFSHLA